MKQVLTDEIIDQAFGLNRTVLYSKACYICTPWHTCATVNEAPTKILSRHPVECFRVSDLWIGFFHLCHLTRVISLKFSHVATVEGYRVHPVLYYFSCAPR